MSRLHPSTSSWFETAFGLLTMRVSDFNGLDLMVSLSRFDGLTVRPWAASFFNVMLKG